MTGLITYVRTVGCQRQPFISTIGLFTIFAGGITVTIGGTVYLESGFPTSTRDRLRELGHTLKPTDDPGGFGGYQGIWIDWENGVLRGASDPRKDGAAVGY